MDVHTHTAALHLSCVQSAPTTLKSTFLDPLKSRLGLEVALEMFARTGGPCLHVCARGYLRVRACACLLEACAHRWATEGGTAHSVWEGPTPEAGSRPGGLRALGHMGMAAGAVGLQAHRTHVTPLPRADPDITATPMQQPQRCRPQGLVPATSTHQRATPVPRADANFMAMFTAASALQALQAKRDHTQKRAESLIRWAALTGS